VRGAGPGSARLCRRGRWSIQLRHPFEAVPEDTPMTLPRRTLVAALALALAAPLALTAQDLHPSRRPSPLGIARTTLGDAYVRVIYGRPYKRGRNNIFGTKASGALVPYGERWRTGANEATEITVTRDVL